MHRRIFSKFLSKYFHGLDLDSHLEVVCLCMEKVKIALVGVSDVVRIYGCVAWVSLAMVSLD